MLPTAVSQQIDTHLESTKQREALCLGLATGIHILMFFWNPTILKSDYKPAHDFVTVDVVEQPAPGGQVAEAPKKMGLMDTLKDMLLKPKTEEIAHIAPEPVTARVAAPIRPALQEKQMPRSLSTAFQPKSSAEDLAMTSNPDQIKTESRNFAMAPTAPSLTAKSFGGIKAKDLPFQVGGDESISGGGASIPIAVGKGSAKAALSYGGASLKESNTKPILQGRTGYVPGGAVGELNSLGAGSANTIQISGTGGTGNAPTGATSGSSLHDRPGSGSGGGLVSRAMFGSGRGGGIGSGIEGMPSAAAALDQQLSANASGGGQGGKKVGNKGFELAGPLTNRPIVRKVIPQYPAWAEEQGIIGSVRLYFTVTPEGTVRTNIRVTKTTGYPQLDQLAIDALKQWQFSAVGSSDEGKGEWGIITFNFALSS